MTTLQQLEIAYDNAIIKVQRVLSNRRATDAQLEAAEQRVATAKAAWMAAKAAK